MIAKILLYILIISIIGFEEYYFGVFHDIAKCFFPLLLLVIYLIMLNLEIKKRSALGQSYSVVTKAGFIFSFFIGIISDHLTSGDFVMTPIRKSSAYWCRGTGSEWHSIRCKGVE